VDVKDVVKATVINGPEAPYHEDKPKHNKNPAVGTKKVTYSKTLIFDQEDVKLFKQDEEITLMNWGNAYVRKINGSNPITDIELERKGYFRVDKAAKDGKPVVLFGIPTGKTK